MHPRAFEILGYCALVRWAWDIHLLVADTFQPKDAPVDMRNTIIRRGRGVVAVLYIQDQINPLGFERLQRRASSKCVSAFRNQAQYFGIEYVGRRRQALASRVGADARRDTHSTYLVVTDVVHPRVWMFDLRPTFEGTASLLVNHLYTRGTTAGGTGNTHGSASETGVLFCKPLRVLATDLLTSGVQRSESSARPKHPFHSPRTIYVATFFDRGRYYRLQLELNILGCCRVRRRLAHLNCSLDDETPDEVQEKREHVEGATKPWS